MQFPVYRKYFSGLSYYKINSNNEFEELQLVGSEIHIHAVKAHQYPEKLRIQDMIKCKDDIWSEMSKEEFEEIRMRHSSTT
ncbi:MAG: hypothetical protein CL840_13600 [Crocinitomicaceae bacterium]|nr:hypothetical protein [Crocinitomicaceae bacterium]|tara:strand:- start:7313 stop:7555 length:243 start_codon:yes stop_codon:yes gene_type:complete